MGHQGSNSGPKIWLLYTLEIPNAAGDGKRQDIERYGHRKPPGDHVKEHESPEDHEEIQVVGLQDEGRGT